MAYKGKHILVNSALDFNKRLVDWLVNEVGWAHDPNSPTIDLTARTAQDDKHAFKLGWFLKSNGEDGNQNIPIHIGWQDISNIATSYTMWYGRTAYLSAGISATDTAITLKSAMTNLANGDIIQIGDELIYAGVVSGANLSSCVRGYYGTTATTHDVKDVVGRITGSAPAITVFGVRDLATPLLSSSGTPSWSFGETATSSNNLAVDLPRNTSRDASKLNHSTLVKITSGAESGKWRWVTAQPCTITNQIGLTYDEFYGAPGAASCEIYSGGMHPSVSRHMSIGPNGSSYTAALYPTAFASPKDVWLYGSKNGFTIVLLAANNTYRMFYFGQYAPYGNMTATTATSAADGDIALGATQIKVANINLFAVGGRYMLLSASPALDYRANCNQISNSYMGAPGGGSPNSWPNLDGDEACFEYVLVTNVNLVSNVITVQCGTCYSYKAGALIGECLRPHIGYACQSDGAANQFAGSSLGGYANCVVWHAHRNSRVFTTHPAHRVRWRCCQSENNSGFPTVKPWNADFGRNAYVQRECAYGNLGDGTAEIGASPEPYSGSAMLLAPRLRDTDPGNDRSAWGGDMNRRPGYIPGPRAVNNVWSALNEDLIRVMFQGAYCNFRLFYHSDSGYWWACGPETD
jgi:hypothetical protein